MFTSKQLQEKIDSTIKSLREKNVPDSDIEEAVAGLRTMYKEALESEEKDIDNDITKKFDEMKKNVEAKAEEMFKNWTDKKDKEDAENAEKTAKVYGYSGNKAIGELEKEEKSGEFLRHLIKYASDRDPQSFAVVKALSEGSDANGGHLVPEEFRMDIITDLRETGVMRRLATIFPMSSKTLELPKLTARPEAYWGSENATSTTTSADFGNLVLTAYKLISRIYTSSELAEDSSPEIVSLLRGLFVTALREAEDKAFFTGSGSGRPKGLNQETYRGFSAAGTLTASKIIDLFYTLPSAYRRNATWVMNTRTWSAVVQLKDSQGQFLVDREILKNNTTPVLMGRPVETQDDLESTSIFLGDFKMYYIGDRKQISVAVSTEADNTFAKDQVQIKVRERVDGRVALTSAFVEMSNTGTN